MEKTRSLRLREASVLVLDRRGSARMPANGELTLVLDSPEGMGVPARLVDISSEGFRATHTCRLLHSGQEVTFRLGQQSGRAVAVWSRIEANQCESGFRILKPDERVDGGKPARLDTHKDLL